MIARETMKTKLIRLGRQSRRTGQVRLPTEAVALGVETTIRFLMAAVLAGAVLLEEKAPFGVAMVAASGAGWKGGGALLGACFGAMTMLGFAQGLRSAAAAVLTFAIAFAFYDLKLFRRPWVMPIVAGAVNAFAGAVVQSRIGWRPQDVIHAALELGLTVAAVWAYRAALVPAGENMTRGRAAGLLFLGSTLLMALAPLHIIYKDISLGAALEAMGVLTAAWLGGSAPGGAVGLAGGMALDLSAGGNPIYAMAFGLSGLVCGLCRGRRRLTAALTFAVTCTAGVLWTWELDKPLPILYETALGVLIFLLLPGKPLGRLGMWLTPAEGSAADPRAQRLNRKRLEAASQAFRALSESLRAAFRPPRNDNDMASVFDRAAGRVCCTCPLSQRCWKEDYTTTFNAMNDATPAMVERGRAEAGDFPAHFAHRCIRLSAYLAAVNEELTVLFYRRQYSARARENRAAVCRQYEQLSDLLETVAMDLGRELIPDRSGERQLRQYLADLGVKVRAAVFRDERKRLRVEAEGVGCPDLARPSRLADLSALLGVPLRVELEGEGLISLIQQEPFMAVAGVAARRKDGETVSGDAGTYFKRTDGKLYVLLCDGMGSGPEANRESSLAIRLLEQFLQAGVEAKPALATLSSALALRGEETGGFTTVDLLQVDLFTGESELFKLGAAPTYVKKGGVVQRLTGTSLPAGLGEGMSAPMDQFSLRLAPGDTVLMVSDGICGGGEDQWLQDQLARFDGTSPKDLARVLITDSPQEATDDRTALVIRIEERLTAE